MQTSWSKVFFFSEVSFASNMIGEQQQQKIAFANFYTVASSTLTTYLDFFYISPHFMKQKQKFQKKILKLCCSKSTEIISM